MQKIEKISQDFYLEEKVIIEGDGSLIITTKNNKIYKLIFIPNDIFNTKGFILSNYEPDLTNFINLLVYYLKEKQII